MTMDVRQADIHLLHSPVSLVCDPSQQGPGKPA